MTCDGLGSNAGEVLHEFSVGSTNGRYAMRLISRKVQPVSSLNCDTPLHSGIRVPEL